MELTIERKRIRVTAVLVALITLSLLVLPASAAINQIAQGADVFIGEEGLDVTAAVGNFTQIAWFALGKTPATDIPNYIVVIGNAASFYVAPADFVGRTGNWYVWDGGITRGVVAFNVVDPNIDIKIWDQNANKDVTGKQVPAGNVENFRVETNTYSVINRPSYAGEGFVNIKVKTTDGATYSALETPANVMKTLTGQAITQSVWYWAVPAGNTSVGWDTAAKDDAGFPLYNTGIYTVSAELNLNKIKDNYKAPDGKDYTGKTVTSLKTIAIASDYVKIEASKDTVVRGNQFSVTVTGRADEYYYVWVKGTSSMTGGAGDQPPIMAASQDNVANDPVAGPYTIGSYVYEGGAGKTIKQDVATGPDNGVYYYAKIKTSASGTRTVGFRTTPNTKDGTYTIRVENNFGGQYTSDDVNVKVEKGIVTIVAAGDQNYFLGQEVRFSGVNSETGNVYLFITGPNLPANGGLLTDPSYPACGSCTPPVFTVTDVNDDNTWEYKWQTANLPLSPGNYTIYAVESPNDKSQLTSNTLYATVPIIIRDPFVTASVSQGTVQQGNNLFVRGVAEGDPSQGVVIWVIGQNFIAYNTEAVNDDGTFEYEVDGGMTSGMTSGQYFVVVQHPMYNDELDVYPQANGGYTYRYVVGPYPTANSVLFTLEGPGSLQGSEAVNALTTALDNSAVDDTYVKLEFLVEGEFEAPIANFTANVTSGITPLTVVFTDASTGTAPLTYAWDLDNNGVIDSTYPNPVVHYTSPGKYTVNLTVTNEAGSDTEVKVDYINVTLGPPVADFSTNTTSGVAPLTVAFTDESTGYLDSWAWDFDNNGAIDSTDEDPLFTYPTSGTYTVNLTVTGPGGVDSQVKTNYITVTEAPVAPVAAFSANTTSGVAPLTVAFMDASTGTEPLTYKWDFTNDGSIDSTTKNPTFTYTSVGTYTVNHTVTGPGGSDSDVKTNYITVNAVPTAPTAQFTANTTSGTAPLTVQFTEQSLGYPISSWAWDFGDSANSTLQNPVHTYTNYGTYNVSLTVTNAAGEDTIVKNDYIQVIPMVGGDKGYYLIHCNVEGAKVYFDEDYKGDIINGTLLVKIYLTATPYHRYSVSKAGYVTVNEALPTYPAKDETKDIFVTLVDVTDGSWTRPPYPEVTRIQPGYPDSNWTRPPYPEVTRIQPGYPDSNWTRPPYPEVTRIQPGYPDSNWTRPAYLDWIWNRSSFHNFFKEMFDLQ